MKFHMEYPEPMKYHAKVFYIKGLNLGDKRFVWNDKLLLINSGEQSPNIAEAHILVIINLLPPTNFV